MRRTVLRIKTSAAAAAAAAAAPVKNASKAVHKSLQDSAIAVADVACASVVGIRWQKLSAVTIAPGGGLSDGCTDRQALKESCSSFTPASSSSRRLLRQASQEQQHPKSRT
uniref:Uncharacterized protein n=1 Tax=Tetradesmus obliquus TaxID=3088 RepID=A0A383VIV0_TETOB|eukprot:jgi/Sobl393_1/661/SZX64759.1